MFLFDFNNIFTVNNDSNLSSISSSSTFFIFFHKNTHQIAKNLHNEKERKNITKGFFYVYFER